MTNDPQNPLSRDDADLPPDLRRHLQSLYTPPTPMGAARDADLLAAARRLPAAPRSGRWRLAAGAGLAAAVAIAATLYWASPTSAPAPAYARTGDIRDAYALARELKASDGKKTPPEPAHPQAPAWWDANRDGRVDTADVDALALAVVQLPPARAAGGAR